MRSTLLADHGRPATFGKGLATPPCRGRRPHDPPNVGRQQDRDKNTTPDRDLVLHHFEKSIHLLVLNDRFAFLAACALVNGKRSRGNNDGD
jgi:hypothetical protein